MLIQIMKFFPYKIEIIFLSVTSKFLKKIQNKTCFEFLFFSKWGKFFLQDCDQHFHEMMESKLYLLSINTNAKISRIFS